MAYLFVTLCLLPQNANNQDQDSSSAFAEFSSQYKAAYLRNIEVYKHLELTESTVIHVDGDRLQNNYYIRCGHLLKIKYPKEDTPGELILNDAKLYFVRFSPTSKKWSIKHKLAFDETRAGEWEREYHRRRPQAFQASFESVGFGPVTVMDLITNRPIKPFADNALWPLSVQKCEKVKEGNSFVYHINYTAQHPVNPEKYNVFQGLFVIDPAKSWMIVRGSSRYYNDYTLEWTVAYDHKINGIDIPSKIERGSRENGKTEVKPGSTITITDVKACLQVNPKEFELSHYDLEYLENQTQPISPAVPWMLATGGVCAVIGLAFTFFSLRKRKKIVSPL